MLSHPNLPNRMKKLIIVLFFFGALNSAAQSDNCYKELITDVLRNLNFPPSGDDTCYHYSSLLVMEINKKSKITNLTFSDNAPLWMAEDLERIKSKKRINTEAINLLLKEKKMKNIILLFPLTYVLASRCIPSRFEYYPSDDKRYFSVNGKLLTGNIQFCKPEVIGVSRWY